MAIDETKFNQIFARNLRYYLEKNHMSQIELSKKIGVGTTSVYNWCNGVKIPRMDKVDKMCQIFGCKRSDLITDTQAADSATNQEFMLLFENADPAIQQAVLTLLKSAKH